MGKKTDICEVKGALIQFTFIYRKFFLRPLPHGILKFIQIILMFAIQR